MWEKLKSTEVPVDLVELSGAHAGFIDRISFNNISYADDMTLLAPSVNTLDTLISICENYAIAHGLVYNIRKTVYLTFRAPDMEAPDETLPTGRT